MSGEDWLLLVGLGAALLIILYLVGMVISEWHK